MRLDLPSLIPGVFDSTIKGRVKTQAERDLNARSDELAAHVGSLNDVLHAKINEEMSKLLDENHKKALEGIKNIKP